MSEMPNGASRIRWTVVDLAPTVGYSTQMPEECSSSLYDSAHTEEYVFMLKRLMKPDYYRLMKMLGWGTVMHGERWPAIDSKVFIDLDDQSMWITVDEPTPASKFYQMMVDSDLFGAAHPGYELDTKPSQNLVCLASLRESFVEWWCK